MPTALATPDSLSLLVLGATGGVGTWVTRLAAQRGHRVTAVARNPEAMPAIDGVTVTRGDALVPGHDVVVSCVGRRRAGRSPFARPLSPPDLVERAMRALCPAMAQHGVPRLALVSAGGVRESVDALSAPVRWFLSLGEIGVSYADLARAEAVVERTALDWMAVRPVVLVDGAPTGAARVTGRFGLRSTIRRADVAQWMLAQVEAPAPFAQRLPMLAG